MFDNFTWKETKERKGLVNLRDLVLKARSYRRFHEDVPVRKVTLKALVDYARLGPSALNLQPYKYVLSCDPDANAKIFSCLTWAGYLKEWKCPPEGERPPAYIVIVGDTEITKTFGCDLGIAAQNILLAATEMDLGGCIMGSIRKKELRKLLKIPVRYKILLVMPIGKPKEKITIDRVGRDGDIKYWRDINELHHVPKRALSDVILEP